MSKNRQIKQAIRKAALAERGALSRDFIDHTNALAAGRVSALISELFGGRPITVMSYSSFKNEFPTSQINEFLINQHSLILPYTDDNMVIHPLAITDDTVFRTSPLGISEPDLQFCREADPSVVDLVLMPGVAFDRRGSRIGFGAGCYDRFIPLLKKDVPLVALAYNCQLTDNIPAEDHDIPADYIITETETICCRQQRSPLCSE